MREPKFRGFCKETNNWVYGFGWFETDYTNDYLEKLGQSKQDAVLFTNSDAVMCSIDSMGQHAGLKDKNGCEIFEGDILRILDDEESNEGWNEEVVFHRGCYMAGDENLLANVHFRGLVIGNIYEHPPLQGGATK